MDLLIISTSQIFFYIKLFAVIAVIVMFLFIIINIVIQFLVNRCLYKNIEIHIKTKLIFKYYFIAVFTYRGFGYKFVSIM